MNYQLIYNQFISDRKKNQPFENFEKHHITPKSCGGSNDKENLVRLSFDDHVFAHLLLARIYGGGMWHALFSMINEKKTVTSKRYRHSYRIAKTERSKYISKVQKGVPKPSLKGVPLSEETKRKIGAAQTGKKNHMFGRTGKGHPCFGSKHSDESKRKMAISKTGKKQTAEHIKNSAMARVGLKRSDEARQNISNALKGRIRTESHRKNISKALKGRSVDESVKKAISKAMLGSSNHFFGKSHSDETKRKLSEKNKGYKHTAEAVKKMKNRERYECNKCGNYFTLAMLNRWHNEKCRSGV